MEKMRLLKYGSKPCGETRRADFLKYFGRNVETTRIVSFGSCNFHCNYCKRDAQFVDDQGNIIRSVLFDWENEIKPMLVKAIENGERVRLSGGDPVMHQKESLFIAKWAMDNYGKKISIAHNGSSLSFVKKIAPYLDYAAIDLKGGTAKELALRAGLHSEVNGQFMLDSTIKVQNYLSENGVIVDIRTPVFDTTTLDDLRKMASLITAGGNLDNKFWTLRAYKKVKGCDWGEPNQNDVLEYAKILSKEFNIPIGLRLKWSGQKEFKIFEPAILRKVI